LKFYNQTGEGDIEDQDHTAVEMGAIGHVIAQGKSAKRGEKLEDAVLLAGGALSPKVGHLYLQPEEDGDDGPPAALRSARANTQIGRPKEENGQGQHSNTMYKSGRQASARGRLDADEDGAVAQNFMGYQESELVDNEAPLEVIDDLLKECELLQIDIAPAETAQKEIDFHVS